MPNVHHAQVEALDVCPWLCGGPNYPHTPFVGPVFVVVDSLRILICLGALALLVSAVYAIRKAKTSGQRCRFLFLAGVSLVMIGTELQHLGDVPHWRFLVSLVIIPIGLFGTYQHLFHEIPAQDRANELDRPQGSAQP